VCPRNDAAELQRTARVAVGDLEACSRFIVLACATEKVARPCAALSKRPPHLVWR
jgi:hypothetical protein